MSRDSLRTHTHAKKTLARARTRKLAKGQYLGWVSPARETCWAIDIIHLIFAVKRF